LSAAFLYFATVQNDKGIFEQGSPTGKMCQNGARTRAMSNTRKDATFLWNSRTRQGKEMKPLSTGFARASKTKKRALHTKSKARLYFLDLDKD